MTDKFIKINDSMISELSSMLSKEFSSSPVVNYIFPNEYDKNIVLPLIFDRLLKLYKDIGVTYVTSIDMEGTFSLVNFDKENRLYYESLITSIPNILRATLNIDVAETISRLIKAKDTLLNVKDYINFKNSYIFISSIASSNRDNKDIFLKDMLDYLVKESYDKQTPLIVETETEEMVNLYKSYGFKLSRKFTIDNTDINIFLLTYNPKKTKRK
ncbi:hypothetical protein [Clostridium sardiniense]|uniref:hypothetical protein n=1 Tax=Clostridium sardiniense TaxID=29369 RepID=UPI00195AFAEF|nr:hypothetical protein [Clostridium sardiniense]MBM7834673.1 hypothetical protein [Clostridium sardiniense]